MALLLAFYLIFSTVIPASALEDSPPTAYPLGHRFTHRSSPFADRDSPHSEPALVW